MSVVPLRDARSRAISTLRQAAIESAAADADWLLAHVLGVHRGALATHPGLSASEVTTFEGLVADRAARVPLQHLTGSASFRRIDLAVGPGVFVPRPETEGVVEHALRAIARMRRSDAAIRVRVADLGTGSGAIALAIALEAGNADVLAFEISGAAAAWAKRNIASQADGLAAHGSSVRLMRGDATNAERAVRWAADPVAGLGGPGSVDIVVANPPYIPEGAVPRDPEVRDHDPSMALYGGPDGLDVLRGFLRTATALLRPGGVLVVEHGDTQGEDRGSASVPALMRSSGWLDVIDHPDLAGRPRATVATRSSSS